MSSRSPWWSSPSKQCRSFEQTAMRSHHRRTPLRARTRRRRLRRVVSSPTARTSWRVPMQPTVQGCRRGLECARRHGISDDVIRRRKPRVCHGARPKSRRPEMSTAARPERRSPPPIDDVHQVDRPLDPMARSWKVRISRPPRGFGSPKCGTGSDVDRRDRLCRYAAASLPLGWLSWDGFFAPVDAMVSRVG
jgi:hypothetical protein